MAGVEIEINQQQLQDVQQLLGNIKSGAETAMARAINRTGQGAITLTKRGLAEVVNLPQKHMKLDLDKAKKGKLSARLTIHGGRKALVLYKGTNPKTVEGSKKSKKGVAFQTFKNEPRVRLRHAFVAQMKNGHVGVFLRKQGQYKKVGKFWVQTSSKGVAGRLPIEEVTGPSMVTVYLDTPGLALQLESKSADRLEKELAHQIDFILNNA